MGSDHNDRLRVAVVVVANHLAPVLWLSRLQFEERKEIIDHLARGIHIRDALFSVAVKVVDLWDEPLSHVLLLFLGILGCEDSRLLIFVFKANVI